MHAGFNPSFDAVETRTNPSIKESPVQGGGEWWWHREGEACVHKDKAWSCNKTSATRGYDKEVASISGFSFGLRSQPFLFLSISPFWLARQGSSFCRIIARRIRFFFIGDCTKTKYIYMQLDFWNKSLKTIHV